MLRTPKKVCILRLRQNTLFGVLYTLYFLKYIHSGGSKGRVLGLKSPTLRLMIGHANLVNMTVFTAD